jgi:hypothetical protein
MFNFKLMIADWRSDKAKMEAYADDLDSGRWRFGRFLPDGGYKDESAEVAADNRRRANLLGRLIKRAEDR